MRLLLNIAGFLAVLAVVLVASVAFLPADRVARLVSDQLSRQLNREVTMGSAELSVWPVLGIDVSQLVIGNPDWAGELPMLTAERAAIGVDALAAVQGRVEIRRINATAPILRLIRTGDQANWQLSEPSGQGAAPLPLFTLETLSFDDADLSYLENGRETRLGNMDLRLAWPGINAPLDLEATLRPDGRALTVSARIERPRAALNSGAVPVEMQLATPGGTLDFTGLAGLAPEAQGLVQVDLSDLPLAVATLKAARLPAPGAIAQRLQGKAEITLTRDARLSIREGAFDVDGNRAALAADVDLAAKPRLNAQIRAEALDLTALTGTEGPSTGSDGWSTATIDASGLGAFDGEVALVTDALRVGPFRFATTRALMTVTDSRAVIDLRELSGYEGVLTGQFVANNRNGLSVRSDLAFGGVALQPVLSDALGIDRVQGSADGTLSLLGSGQTVAALMASLSGDGAFRAGPGRIDGIDLDKVLSGAAEGGTTIFDDATGSFAITAGTLRNDDLLLSLPGLATRGEARVSLIERSLDALLTVFAPDARNGRGLAVPVRVKGPWSAPQIRVDLGAAIEQNFAEERDALESRARERVNEALQDRLGVTVEEGQSVEDALQRRLEDEARKGLLNLLNR